MSRVRGKGPSEPVRMVYALPDGSVLDHPTLLMAATRGGAARAVDPGELVALPKGSDLYTLPGRTALGIDPESGDVVGLEQGDLIGYIARCAELSFETSFIDHDAGRCLRPA